jgi:HD-GYP domain-containing protein (c-di-GMP phosphodiesterase class II)
MISDRPYRAGRDHEGACQELLRCAGTQFDESVVAAFLRAVAHAERQPPDGAPAA